MKILYITKENISGKNHGGIATYFLALSKSMANLGHDVHLISINEGEVGGDIVENGVNFHYRPCVISPTFEKVLKLFRLYFTVSRLLYARKAKKEAKKLQINFDICEVADWMALGLFLTKRKTPLVVGMHLNYAITFVNPIHFFYPDNWFSNWLEIRVLKKADMVKASSEYVIDCYGSSLNRKKVAIINNPLDTALYPRYLTCKETRKFFLFVGRVEKFKGIEILIDSFSEYLKNNKEAQLLIVGRGEDDYIKYLNNKILQLEIPKKNISFVGAVKPIELVHYYSSARVVIIPSRREIFPYVAQEALACGRPVIITRSCGIAKIIEKNDLGMVLPEYFNKEDLLIAMKKYGDNLNISAEIGERAKNYAENNFSLDVIGRKNEALYKEIIQ